jgi:hypothetical protein
LKHCHLGLLYIPKITESIYAGSKTPASPKMWVPCNKEVTLQLYIVYTDQGSSVMYCNLNKKSEIKDRSVYQNPVFEQDSFPPTKH